MSHPSRRRSIMFWRLAAAISKPPTRRKPAAADIVARLSGNWVERQKSPPPQQLREKARRCVTQILTEPSEMLELWQDTDEFDAWKRSVEAVLARL